MPLSGFNLDRLKMGYVIRYKNDGNWLSNLIEKRQLAAGFTKEDACYTHTEISGGEQDSVNISFPKAKAIDILKTHKGREIQILKYDNTEFANGKRYKVAYINGRLCNKKYDVGGILSFIFKWVKQNNRHFFCSEGCADSFKRVFPKIFGDKTADKIYPADFNLTYNFVEVWKGRIPK